MVNLAFLNEVGVYAELQHPTMRALGVDNPEYIKDPNVVHIDNFYIFEEEQQVPGADPVLLIGVLVVTKAQLLIITAIKGELDPNKAGFQISASPLHQVLQVNEIMTSTTHQVSIEMANGEHTSLARIQAGGETISFHNNRVIFFSTNLPDQSKKLAQTARALRQIQERK
jgi:hypothetical protein